LRKNALARVTVVPPKGPAALTTPALARAASTARGAELPGLLRELAKRDGNEAIAGLAVAASSYDKETAKLGRELLDANLGRLTLSGLRERLEDDNAEVRRGAVRVAAARHIELVLSVIDRLTDADAAVLAEAREALVKRSKEEVDFGPAADATPEQRREAQKRWKAWWLEQTKPR
jgi:hypothetical protein